MLLPYAVDVPMKRVPFANWVLISLTTVVTFAVWANEFAASEEELRHPLLALDPERFAAWQLFTYVLVHAGILHLVGNMIFLFCFGNAVNAKLGHVPFLLCYFVLGAAAGWLQLLLGGTEPIVGASGAIMGLVGIFLVLYPRNEVSVLYWFLGLGAGATGTFEIASAWLIGLYMLWDLVGTVLLRHSGIAYACHVGGEVAGVALASALVLGGFVKSDRGEENLYEVLGVRSAAEPPPRAPAARKRRKQGATRTKGDGKGAYGGWG